MLQHSHYRSVAVLHSTVMLFALSGLFGKWLLLSPITIVFFRAFFATITLWLFHYTLHHKTRAIKRKYLVTYAITGGLLAIHWLTFFQAIQVSSVTVGLITFATFPIIVSFIEPWLTKVAFCRRSLLQALLTVLGVFLVFSSQLEGQNLTEGAVYGVFSAFSFALLTIVNAKFVKNTPARQLAFQQNFFVCIFLLPCLLFIDIQITTEQWLLLVLLGVVFTALTHTMFNYTLKELSAVLVSIAVSLEPVYGIIAAWLFLNEILSVQMIFGITLVIAMNLWAAKKRI